MENRPLALNGVKFVLFDWDNTLAESRTALLYAINEVIKNRKLPGFDELNKKRNNDLSFKENFINFFGSNAEEIYKEYAKIYLANVDRLISTFDGVQEVLDFLHARGVKLMIMSNKDRELLEHELPILFEPGLFERIVCGQEALRDKPFPEHVYYALRGYLKPEEINRRNVWVVGDSPQDSTCALASKALPIRIGEDIWHEHETCSKRIVYFDNFRKFYEALKSKN